MHAAKLTLVIMAALLALAPAVARADANEAKQAFDNGKALLAKGDFKAAADAFKQASEADPENKDYATECTLLRRVLNLREQMAAEQDADMIGRMGQVLYSYYRQYHVDAEAVTLATSLHAKLNTAETAAMLASAHLTLGQNAEAAAVLAGLDPAKADVRTGVLHGIAQARLGKANAAKAIATTIELPKDCSGELCYEAARLYALVGDKAKALATLKCAFECTPPNEIATLKADVKASQDLAKIAGETEFAQVLETASKVKAGCGACPSKATCGHDKDKGAAPLAGQAKPAEKEGEAKSGQAGCTHEKK